MFTDSLDTDSENLDTNDNKYCDYFLKALTNIKQDYSEVISKYADYKLNSDETLNCWYY